MSVSQIALVAVVLAVVLVAVAMPLRARRSARAHQAHRPPRGRRDERLPQGADAALWSIVEAMPDPRNHLALTRDLTGEVRITDGDRSLSELLAQGPATAGGPVRARS